MSKQQAPFDLNELRGSIAVVTGAGNNGIGWGICKHAAGELGMHVVAMDLHENLVQSAQNRLSRQFPQVQSIGIQGDVTQPDSLDHCLATVREAMPGKQIGAVFANAGVQFNHTVLKSTVEEWATTLNVNVMGVVNTIKTFVPVLREQGIPSIVCSTASVGGLVRGDGGVASYQASKHAVVVLMESLSFELARRSPHIRLHVLCPCIVESSLFQTSRTNEQIRSGNVDATAIEPSTVASNPLGMTTEIHAQQVFDQISAGNFYMITDSVRPYVDHDRPFDGLSLVRERYQNMLDGQLDNGDAWSSAPGKVPSSILKGPMFDRD